MKVEGDCCSTPSGWAPLRATAYIGVEQVRFFCMGGSVTHPRIGFGRHRVVYRHYLPEIARKPPAVRQVASELLAELENHGAGCSNLLAGAHGGREAARVLAKLLSAIEEHGEDRVRTALEMALTQHHVGLLDVIARTPDVSLAHDGAEQARGFRHRGRQGRRLRSSAAGRWRRP